MSNFGEFLPEKFPVFIWQRDNKFTYGFPAINGPKGGIKIASEKTDIVDPDNVNREVSEKEKQDFYAYAADALPNVGSKCIKAIVCFYTQTPDSHFVIDYHPEFPNVVIASPCFLPLISE